MIGTIHHFTEISRDYLQDKNAEPQKADQDKPHTEDGDDLSQVNTHLNFCLSHHSHLKT